MKKIKTPVFTIEKALMEASNYEITATKSVHINQKIHQKFKSILVDDSYDNVTLQKLVNVILYQWIQTHKIELQKRLIANIEKDY